MKKVLSAVLLLLPCIAFAGFQIPEGSVKQDSCGVSGYDARHKVWKLDRASSRDIEVKNKLSLAGKTVSIGETLFYANVVSVTKHTYFESQSDDVARVSHSLFPSASSIKKGQKLPLYGTLTSPDLKTRYRLLVIPTGGDMPFMAALGENGYLCSGQFVVVDGTLDVSEYDVYEKFPLVKSETTSTSDEGTIAIGLASMSDMFATISVKQIKDGQVAQEKTMQLDMMSGHFQIEGLIVSFEKKEKTSLKIKSIEEPKDYSVWLNRIKSSLFNAK
ncbi:MAG: hypothetical protein WC710_01905 [Gallionella sp.]|jgi:hypothetical protein